MKFILKTKWFILAAWVVVIAVLLITAPNLADLVRNKGQANVPAGYSSSTAQKMLDEMHKQNGTGDTSSVALVFNDKKGLSKSEINDVKHAVKELKDKKDKLGITSITNSFDQPDLKNELVSSNGKTILVSINMTKGNKQAGDITRSLYKAIDDVHVDHYYTSSWMIDEDMVTSTQNGLHKTEWITIVFILVVLFVVFRSIVAPIVPLITVGFSFLVSQAIVAFLAKSFNFPLSNFTQIFLVAVLFGIGTDYCILLLSRFKEELPKYETTSEAIVATYKNAGRTVFFSGLAVLIGFATIGLSTFSIYQSAVGVAIGIIALIAALLTVVPFFMAVLGTRLFWPAKGSLEHKQSRFWGAIGRFSLARSFIALLIVAIIVVPFLFKYNGDLSFNTLNEIGGNYKSVEGFNIISDNFGPGESMPTTIVIKNDDKLNTEKGLMTIEAISREVKKVPGVKTVRSVTRPTGAPIKDFLVPYQAKSLNNGIQSAQDAVDKIGAGLSDASNKLAKSKPQLKQATDGLQSLINGTSSLKSGVNKLGDGIGKLANALSSSSSGAKDLQNGLAKSQQGASNLASQSQKLLNGYDQISNQLSQLTTKYQQVEKGLGQLNEGLGAVRQNLAGLGKDHPEITNDQNYKQAVNRVNTLQSSSDNLQASMKQLNSGLNQLTNKLNQANNGLSQLAKGQSSLADGLDKLVNGMAKLQSSLAQEAQGGDKLHNSVPSVESGLDNLQQGQENIKQGFSQLSNQISQLSDGLSKSSDGLKKVSDGLGDSRQYLSDLSDSNSPLAGFYIPDQAMKDPAFKQALDSYMSKDRKITTLDVVFKENPYSIAAINRIDDLQKAVDRASAGTTLENAKVGISGVTSTYNDLKQISKHDYSRTMLLMLIGIGLILIVLFRSLIMPLYIIFSLLITYYTSMGISETIFENVFGYSGISWAVPFFAFVMLVALGVDYSIFLMDRFNEYRTLSVKDAMLESMKNMGTVILSAAVILGGTFGAMIPSGVLSLMEIATIIIVGLALYALLMLPLFIPVMVRIFGESNWWPFRRNEH